MQEVRSSLRNRRELVAEMKKLAAEMKKLAAELKKTIRRIGELFSELKKPFQNWDLFLDDESGIYRFILPLLCFQSVRVGLEFG